MNPEQESATARKLRRDMLHRQRNMDALAKRLEDALEKGKITIEGLAATSEFLKGLKIVGGEDFDRIRAERAARFEHEKTRLRDLKGLPVFGISELVGLRFLAANFIERTVPAIATLELSESLFAMDRSRRVYAKGPRLDVDAVAIPEIVSSYRQVGVDAIAIASDDSSVTLWYRPESPREPVQQRAYPIDPRPTGSV